MRILVFSDSHGDQGSMMAAIEEQRDVNTILFLGDGMGDIEKMEELYPAKIFYKVRGNCDFASLEAATRILELSGKRILMTHGHEYHVKFGFREAEYTARRNGCDLLLFGHTHQPLTEYRDGMYLMNPGSLARRNSNTYGVVDLEPSGIFCNIIEL